MSDTTFSYEKIILCTFQTSIVVTSLGFLTQVGLILIKDIKGSSRWKLGDDLSEGILWRELWGKPQPSPSTGVGCTFPFE